MWFCKVATLLLLANIPNIEANDDFDHNVKPLIELLNPKGFRMSIRDHSSIGAVEFRMSINEELPHSEDVGLYKQLRHSVRERWTWEEPTVSLKIGDTMFYSMHVVSNRIGYRTSGQFQVTELPSSSTQTSTQATCRNCNTHNNPRAPPTTSSPEATTDFQLPIHQQLFSNWSQNLLNQQLELEAVRNKIQQLTSFVEKYPDAKTLTMHGRIPPEGNAILTASFVLREKLGLNPDIVSAERKSDDSIEFKVATLAEKLEILEVAKEKLISSRITIS